MCSCSCQGCIFACNKKIYLCAKVKLITWSFTCAESRDSQWALAASVTFQQSSCETSSFSLLAAAYQLVSQGSSQGSVLERTARGLAPSVFCFPSEPALAQESACKQGWTAVKLPQNISTSVRRVVFLPNKPHGIFLP